MNTLAYSEPVVGTADLLCLVCGRVLGGDDYDEGLPATRCVSCDEAKHKECGKHDHCLDPLCAQLCEACNS